MMLQRAFTLTLLLQPLLQQPVIGAENQIDAIPSDGNYIHSETDIDLSGAGYRGNVSITSNVPVTISRYAYTGLMGQEAVPEGYAKVLVTSNCATDDTSAIPSLVRSSDGFIDVALTNLPAGETGSDYDLLQEPSSYSAFWTWVNDFCGGNNPFGEWTPTAPAVDMQYEEVGLGEACQVQVIGAAPAVSITAEMMKAATAPEGKQMIDEMPVMAMIDEMPVMAMPAMDEAMPEVMPEAMPVFDELPAMDEAMPVPVSGICGANAFCKLPSDTCSSPGVYDGVCEKVPEVWTEQFDPVCGCDGRPYDNEGNANSQGASVAYKGECAGADFFKPPPGLDGCEAGFCRDKKGACAEIVNCFADPCATVQCAEGDFCMANYCGGCRAECKPGIVFSTACEVPFQGDVPDFCTDDYNPVCGCDGETHSNACYASSKGVNVKSKGECPESSVPGTGCDVPFQGEIPDFCTEQWDPVCGCDGRTYGNPCNASSNNVNVKSQGECLIPPVFDTQGEKCQVSAGEGVDDPTPCLGENEFCELGEGVCLEKSMFHSGTCVVPPQRCAYDYNPVCGCDGLTYGNACGARAAGVSVVWAGECPAPASAKPAPTTSAPGEKADIESILLVEVTICELDAITGEATIRCGADEFCLLSEGVCMQESVSHIGTCMKTPNMCIEIYRPVCGCDDNTYENSCKAEEAGASVKYQGECKPEVITVVTPTNLAPITVATDICDINMPCSEVGTSCTRGEETCCGVTYPSLECDCADNGGGKPTYMCMYTDACMMPSCCMGVPWGMPPAAQGTCQTGSLCSSGVDDDYCCNNFMSGGGTYCSKTGGLVVESIPDVPVESIPDDTTTSTATTVGSTSAATTVASTSGMGTTPETTATTSATSTQNFTIDGDFPTAAPNSTDSGPTPAPSTWWELNGVTDDGANGTNGAFSRPRSFSFCMATTLMVIALLSVVFPGSNGNIHIWGFGKFAVAAMAVTSLYPKRNAKEGNIRKANQRVNSRERILQQPTCHYNVEILIDGCSHPVDITAPLARIVDVVSVDQTQDQDPTDECVTEYKSTLTFPVPATQVLTFEETKTVALPSMGFEPQCAKAVIGRPFVDATGGSLQATPLISGNDAGCDASTLSWTGETLAETHASPVNNVTAHGQYSLGEDWAYRALGEHASVASFSAFSIALMTNQAPSALVDAALKAGLDEIRHAKVSFDIASKLTGKEVGPGPLPESKHEFGQDLKSLALAVAREGCVDETLSVFAAAVEVDHITKVLEGGVQDSPYSGIDTDLLAVIRSELITIAKDEGNHSALAWRTLNWVCGVDSDVCDDVHRVVFEDSNVDMRFNQRAEDSFGETSLVFHSMRDEWKKIFSAHKLALASLGDESISEAVCTGADITESGDQSLVASVTANVMRQVVCN